MSSVCQNEYCWLLSKMGLDEEEDGDLRDRKRAILTSEEMPAITKSAHNIRMRHVEEFLNELMYTSARHTRTSSEVVIIRQSSITIAEGKKEFSQAT